MSTVKWLGCIQVVRSHCFGTKSLFRPPRLCFHNCQFLCISDSSKNRKKELEMKLTLKSTKMKNKMDTNSPIVTLVDETYARITLRLSAAERLAERRGSSLVLDQTVVGSDTPVYKLEPKTKLSTNPKIRSTYIKGVSDMVLSGNITEHDLRTKISTILRVLSKMKQIKLTINSATGKSSQIGSILDEIKKEVSKCGGKLCNVHKSEHFTKCDINPPRPSKDMGSSDDESSN